MPCVSNISSSVPPESQAGLLGLQNNKIINGLCRPIYRELIKYSFLKSYESLKRASLVLYVCRSQ